MRRTSRTCELSQLCCRERLHLIGMSRAREVSDHRRLTRIVRAESEDDVTVVGHGDGILGGRQVELSVQEAAFIEVQRVLQIDLLHILVGRAADTDHVERVTVQVEGMRQIGLLHCNRARGRIKK